MKNINKSNKVLQEIWLKRTSNDLQYRRENADKLTVYLRSHAMNQDLAYLDILDCLEAKDRNEIRDPIYKPERLLSVDTINDDDRIHLKRLKRLFPKCRLKYTFSGDELKAKIEVKRKNKGR